VLPVLTSWRTSSARAEAREIARNGQYRLFGGTWPPIYVFGIKRTGFSIPVLEGLSSRTKQTVFYCRQSEVRIAQPIFIVKRSALANDDSNKNIRLGVKHNVSRNRPGKKKIPKNGSLIKCEQPLCSAR